MADYQTIEQRLDTQYAMIVDLQQKLASIMETGQGKINCAEANVKSLFSHEDIQGQAKIRATGDIEGAAKLSIVGESTLQGDVAMQGSATVGKNLTAVETVEGQHVKARQSFQS